MLPELDDTSPLARVDLGHSFREQRIGNVSAWNGPDRVLDERVHALHANEREDEAERLGFTQRLRACVLVPRVAVAARERKAGAALDGDGDVAPVRPNRPFGHETFECANDGAEFVMLERPDQDAARMATSCLGPLAHDGRKVATVPRDEDPSFGGCQREHVEVIQTLVLRMFGEREYVVPAIAKKSGDSATREIGVEKQPHPARLSARR
jgi:hypothetical protein